MTPEAARAVASICMTADGGCYHCAGKLINALIARFPDNREDFLSVWLTEYSERRLEEVGT